MKDYIILFSSVVIVLGFGYTADVIGGEYLPKTLMVFNVFIFFLIVGMVFHISDKKDR